MTIGEQIQNLRMKKGMTQERLAEALEVSRQSVSKWELGQAIPDIDKVIKLSEVFEVSTDKLLLKEEAKEESRNILHLVNIYVVVKDFKACVDFYEKFLNLTISKHEEENEKIAEFFIGGRCLTIMNENNLREKRDVKVNSKSFIQTYWVEDLAREYERLKDLNIGVMTKKMDEYPNYHYFQINDPEGNIIEINGGYQMNVYFCQSCGMPLTDDKRSVNEDGTTNSDYCMYCYNKGHFSKNITLEEMIEYNLKYIDEYNKHSEYKMTLDELRKHMEEYMPTLKRWKK